MNDTPDPGHCDDRKTLRRRQILEAAAGCFREQGFDGASMASICKAARMSPGHVYHFFASKDEIIEAIVAEDLQQMLARFDELDLIDDATHAVVDGAAAGLALRVDAEQRGLGLEVLAAAQRNPRVSAAVRQAYTAAITRVTRILERAPGQQDDAQRTAKAAVICALFDGLSIALALNPQLDTERVLPILQTALRSVAEA